MAVVGPTAAGKSALALSLAERLALPILCCDSVQVYRGLDIGSAKPSAEEQARVPHHGLDLVDPDQEFSAGDYGRAGRQILERGPAVICGGTGLYLRALGWSHSGTGGEEDPPRNGDHGEARSAFEVTWMNRETEAPGAVHAELVRRDAATAAGIHPNNVIRALRALWLCERYGRAVSEVRRADPPSQLVDLLLLVVDPGVEAVDAAISRRCAAMLTRGWLAEVEMLRAHGYDARHKAMRSLGYRELLEHLEGRTTLSEAVDAIDRATRKYARRQRTYFRHQFRDLPLEQIVQIDHPDACPIDMVTAFLQDGARGRSDAP